MSDVSTDRTSVPCGTCHACCHGDAVMLGADDAGFYEYEIVTLPKLGRVAVLKKQDGHCIYLVDGKCSIWERAPKACRLFDCRTLYASHSRAERKRLIRQATGNKAVFDAGRERLHTLPD